MSASNMIMTYEKEINWKALTHFIEENQNIQVIQDMLQCYKEQMYWKQRFSNDVLPMINKYYKFCGLTCIKHMFTDKECDCAREDLSPCANCYTYGWCRIQNEDHVQWDTVSFYELKEKKASTVFIKCPYIPTETFMYLCTNLQDRKWSLDEKEMYGKYDAFSHVRNDLPVLLAKKRLEYIQRNEAAYPDEMDEIEWLMYDRKTNFWWWRL